MSFNRKLIAMALGTALLSPLVLAQSPVANVAGQASTNASQMTNTPVSPTLPAQADPRASDAISARTTIQENRPMSPRASVNVNANANANAKSGSNALSSSTAGMRADAAMPPGKTSNASQGAEHAATHSTVVTRDLWLKLDSNADTRLSAAEVAANAGLKASFSAMDSDHNGFVTHAEYRSYSKRHK